MMSYVVYILRTSSNTLYTGQTNNLDKRLKEHKNKTKRSSKYMQSFQSFELAYEEAVSNLSQALKREAEIKKLSHTAKELLIKNKSSA